MTEEEIQFVAKGNPAAAEFLTVFVAHCHLLDDVIDGDQAVTDERLIALEAQWLLVLTGNPFVQVNRALLVPLILQGYNAWLDSNRWAKHRDAYKRVASDVLKGFYHEVVWHTAFLCGGWDHMRAVTTRARDYDFEPMNTLPGGA